MNSKLLVGFAASILFIAPTRPVAAQESCQRPRLISVVGTAEINVAPDEVVLMLGVESDDKVLAVAKTQNDSRAKKVLALAHSVGVEQKDIMTSSVRMRPDYSKEKVPRLLGYEVSQTIRITLKDLSKYETIMTELLEAGVNRVDSVSFRLAETRKYMDEARSKAVAAAKEKAVAMATELGQAVGKPWEISEEGGTTQNLLPGANANYSYSSGVAGEESTVAPGQVTISATVSVSFLLE